MGGCCLHYFGVRKVSAVYIILEVMDVDIFVVIIGVRDVGFFVIVLARTWVLS